MNPVPGAKLVKKIIFSGTIKALTGLHIGGSEAGLAIGGADKVVVRDPRTNQPYIPGSSLKGRMRSLLEKVYCTEHPGFYQPRRKPQYGPCRCGQCDVCRVFGVSAKESDEEQTGTAQDAPPAGAARLLVRDAFLTEQSAKAITSWPNLATDFTEIKTEVAIDRLTSAANPRNFERVPAGAEFQFELVLNVFESDQDKEPRFPDLVLEGLKLVAFDALGGQSSRGYGRVQITVERKIELKTDSFKSNDSLVQALSENKLQSPLVYGPLEQAEKTAA
ncbi:MAG: type III-A CRISPR-associated RAMP protein Csm3 [Deltaproteobacteria bacterium]|nr:type III-A CRISPR-associated RAMP protein Csm3 [Deltaproteobacteria bacterium]